MWAYIYICIFPICMLSGLANMKRKVFLLTSRHKTHTHVSVQMFRLYLAALSANSAHTGPLFGQKQQGRNASSTIKRTNTSHAWRVCAQGKFSRYVLGAILCLS